MWPSRKVSSPAPPDVAAMRAAMVRDQLRPARIRDARVLDAMGAIPRKCFVPEALRHRAYADRPLPIGEGQTISQPAMVAWLVEAAHVQADDVVLEIGAGCGYAAAVLARLAARVVAVERVAALAVAARRRLDALAIRNVDLRDGDGTKEIGSFDAILVSAAAREVPSPSFFSRRPCSMPPPTRAVEARRLSTFSKWLSNSQ